MQRANLHELGVDLPQTEIDYANNINTHAAVREVLIVREKRAKLLQQLEHNALQCHSSASSSCFFPNVVFVPSVSGWSPLRPPDLSRFNLTSISFTEIEMKQTVQQASMAIAEYFGRQDDVIPIDKVFLKASPHDRIVLWALSVLFLNGGIFAGNIAKTGQDVSSLIPPVAKAAKANPRSVYLALYSGESSSSMDTIKLLASSPRSGVVACLLLSMADSNNSSLSLNSEVAPTLGGVLMVKDLMKSRGWLKVSFPKTLGGSRSTCHIPDAQDWTPTDLSDPLMHDTENTLLLLPSRVVRIEKGKLEVDIRPSKASFKGTDLTRSTKLRVQHILRMNNGEPSWLCNRCLNWAFMGTFEKCSSLCPNKYKDTICAPSASKPSVDFDVVVQDPMKGIPRIIHQTWFDDITADRYPQLSRLQASWRNSGWDYRFYTDDDARQYIVDNYPVLFLESFDVLVHGAYKVSFNTGRAHFNKSLFEHILGRLIYSDIWSC